MYRYLQVGKIVNTFGLKGEVKIIPLTDDIDRFEQIDYVLLEDDLDTKLSIHSFRQQGSIVIVKFNEINSIDDALKLKNRYLVIEREKAKKLPENSFFICDIIGLKVYDLNGKYLGEIIDVIQTGSNDVYVINGEKNEILIPALKEVVNEVNITEGYMKIKLIEGLVDEF